MAEQIGIRLSLSGAQQVTGGLSQVSRSLGDLDARTLRVGDALKGLGAGLVAALSVGTITQWVRGAIDAADQAGKLAQSIGVATDQVAGLQLAFRQSGLEADKLGPVMSRLSTAIAGGNKALEAMAVATRNADGSLRGTREVLADVAQRFAGYADGAGKAALANELFGREGARLIPLLNGGATGLAEMDAKARQLGLTLDENATRAAAKFNDEMDLFKARITGLTQSIALQLLPTLNQLIGQLNDGASAYKSFWAATLDIGLNVDPTKSLNENLAATVRQINVLRDGIEKLKASNLPDLLGRRAGSIKTMEEALDRAMARERYLLQQMAREGGRTVSPSAPGTTRPAAPVLPGTAAAGPKDPLGDFIGRQLAAQAQRDIDAAARAEQAQLEMFARVALARQAAYDKAVQEADAALQRELEFWAAVELRMLGYYDQAVAEAEAAQQSQLEFWAAIELRQLEAYDKAEQAAEAAHRAEVALMADRALKAIAAYEALEQAADEAYRTVAAAAQRSADSVRDRLTALQQEEQALKVSETQNVSLTEAIEMLTIARLHERLANEPNAVAAQALKDEIVDRERLIMLIGDRQVREANRQAAEQAARDWQTITEQIGQSLTDALMNGGQKAGDFLKNLFRTMVLRPVIDAVMRPLQAGIGSALGFTGTAATAGGGAGGAMNAATALGGMAAYGSLFGAGATMALTGGTSAALSAAGAAMSAGSVGGGLAIGAGALAPWVIGGMILIQGLSRKLKDTGVTGTFGGEAGFAGEQYKFYKGGFLRGDKTVTEALQDDMQAQLSGTFLQMRQATATMARELGLSADALDTFTKHIELSLNGLTEEQIQQKLAQEFGALGDEMARLVAGSGATAQSLQQLYQAVMSQREQLETRLLELQGDTAALRERERATIHETNLALFDRIIALEDEQAAARAAAEAEAQLAAARARIAQERAGLERELLQVLGDINALRALERAALDESNRALFDRINLLRDAQQAEREAQQVAASTQAALKTITDSLRSELAGATAERLSIAQQVIAERNTLEQRLLQLQDNTTALRERELAAMDPLNRAFARFVFAAEDAKNATEALAQRMSALADAGSSIASFVAELRGGTSTGASLPALRAAYQSTLARAQGGEMSASGEIVGAARAMLTAAQSRARTRAEADLMAARVAAELEALPATKSFQERQAEALQTLVEQGAAAAIANAQADQALLKATTEGFAYLDTTANGLLTFAELKTGLAGIATDEQIKALIGRVDTNADGQIDELELLRALTGNVGENTLATLRENETQVASLRSLVSETIVNSSKLTTLNGTIQSLTISIGNLTSVSQAQASATQTQIASQIGQFNTQGSAQTQSLQKLQQSYQTLYDKALKEFFDTVEIYTGGIRLSEADTILAGGYGYTRHLPGQVKLGRLDPQTALEILSRYDIKTSNGTSLKFAFPSFDEILAGIFTNKSQGTQAFQPGLDNINDTQALIDLLGNISVVQNTVDELRAAIRALGGTPTFATGGLHAGGLRLVGEQGPELEVTGPARYWNASDTMSMLGNAGRREEVLVAEIRALRTEVSNLRAEARATAENTGKTQRLMQRVTRDGESMQVTDVTPAP